ncbi:MAG: hypothetical protein V7734_01590 [Maribacter arcticus]|uniref:hypothetical protein n=1 Tax=Maribacter arcticus TaxID=561365 RepID=UPI00300250C1
MAFFVGSCSSEEGSVFDTPLPDNTDGENENPEEPVEVAALIFNEANPLGNESTASANGEVGTVPGRIIFTSDATTQRRMYITQNVSGQGEMPFRAFALVSDDYIEFSVKI